MIYGIGLVGALTAAVFTAKAIAKKRQKKKDAAFNRFRTELENTTEPENINEAVLNQAFNPTFWKEALTQGKQLISEKTAIEIAKQIAEAWNAGSFWDDLEEEVYRAFEDHRLKTFSDVSKVADAYRSKAVLSKDLWKHLNSKLSRSEFAKVKSIVVKKIKQ
jgi:membrane-bound lytic murein transglycosylase B